MRNGWYQMRGDRWVRSKEKKKKDAQESSKVEIIKGDGRSRGGEKMKKDGKGKRTEWVTEEDGAEDKEGRKKKKKEEASSPYTVIAGRFEFRARLSWNPYK